MNKLFIVTLALFFAVGFSAVTNCATLDASDNTGATCSVCNTGFGTTSDAKACIVCSLANCATCDDGATTTASGTCTKCVDGMGLKNSACTKCTVSNCATCGKNADVCDVCKDGYALDGGKACNACANNCKTCQSDVDAPCDACPTGFVTPNKTTAGAEFCCNSKDCTECSSATKCTKCSGSIKLDEEKGTCFGFKTGASLTLGAIVSVALFSLLF